MCQLLYRLSYRIERFKLLDTFSEAFTDNWFHSLAS
jgi:hypothetical protein